MNSSAPTGRILIKFDIGVLLGSVLRKLKCYWNLTRITGTLHEDLCTFMAISSWIRLRMRNIADKVVKKTKTNFIFNKLFFSEIHGFYEIMCKNIVESYKSQITVWHMSFACWITDAIDTHSEYVILTVCPWQQWLFQRPWMLRLYVQPEDFKMEIDQILKCALLKQKFCWHLLHVCEMKHMDGRHTTSFLRVSLMNWTRVLRKWLKHVIVSYTDVHNCYFCVTWHENT
jgi:hypothetical protein